MGNCVPVQKNPDPAMKLQLSINSKTDSLLIESPIKLSTVNCEHPVGEVGYQPQSSLMTPEASFRDLSGKEEMFFDSHTWMESDCEDFLSVNGDFTPSRGNTPIHQSSFIETPQFDKSLYMDSIPNSIPELSPSPTDMKKQLIELFRESFNDDHRDQNLLGQPEAKPTIFDLPSKSTNKSPYESIASSVCSTQTTPNTCSNPRKKKSAQSAQCCIPSLVRGLSFSERKKRLSPAYSGGR